MPGKENSFDEIRIILAFIVLMAHTQALSGTSELDWLTKYFNSDFAIKGFFAISGYLVTKSFYSSKNTFVYFEKRIRRICPAYFAVILYCLLIGLIVTNLDLIAFLTHPQSYKYIGANAVFLNFLQPSLPGVFDGFSIPAMNGSLWTIKVELMLYFLVPIIAFGYKKIGYAPTLIFAFVIGISWFTFFRYGIDHPLAKTISYQFPGQLPYFAFGSFLGMANINDRLLKTGVLISMLYFLVRPTETTFYMEYINMVFYPICIIGLSQMTYLKVGIGKFGDLSYGVYLYHFPTIQILRHFNLYEYNAYLGLGLSILATLLLAFMSWHLIEKRFLKRSSHYVQETK